MGEALLELVGFMSDLSHQNGNPSETLSLDVLLMPEAEAITAAATLGKRQFERMYRMSRGVCA